MKPAPFDYAAPATLDEALTLVDEGARPLAGGQSLVPLLNARQARPRLLVDLNGVTELSGIRRDGDTLRIGAMTRQAAIERSPEIADGWPLIVAAIRNVAHAAIRSRGTIGGSLAHADPSAQVPCVLAALDARLRVRSARGSRVVSADELVCAPFETRLHPNELLVEVEVPAVAAGVRCGFAEYARTQGSFPLACVAVVGGRIVVALRDRCLVVVSSLADAGIEDPYSRALVAELFRRATS